MTNSHMFVTNVLICCQPSTLM